MTKQLLVVYAKEADSCVKAFLRENHMDWERPEPDVSVLVPLWFDKKDRDDYWPAIVTFANGQYKRFVEMMEAGKWTYRFLVRNDPLDAVIFIMASKLFAFFARHIMEEV